MLLSLVAALPCSPPPIPRITGKDPRSTTALFVFGVDGKNGYMDRTGRIVIPPRYPWGLDFVEGFAVVSQDTFIDEHGTETQVPNFSLGFSFSESRIVAREITGDHRPFLVDPSGHIIAGIDAETIGRFSEGLAAFTETKGWRFRPGQERAPRYGHRTGYLDKSGKIAIRPKFASGAPFSEGLALVALDGNCYLDRLGPGDFRTHVPAPSAPVEANMCEFHAPVSVTTPCSHGFIDRTGRFRIPALFENGGSFSEHRAAVRLAGKWGFIDPSGTQAVPFAFDEVGPFSEGLAAVRLGTRWGYIDRSGATVITPQFDDALPFSSGIAAVKRAGHYLYVDSRGRVVISGPFTLATPFVQGLARVLLPDTRYVWIDSSGAVIFADARPISPRRPALSR